MKFVKWSCFVDAISQKCNLFKLQYKHFKETRLITISFCFSKWSQTEVSVERKTVRKWLKNRCLNINLKLRYGRKFKSCFQNYEQYSFSLYRLIITLLTISKMPRFDGRKRIPRLYHSAILFFFNFLWDR